MQKIRGLRPVRLLALTVFAGLTLGAAAGSAAAAPSAHRAKADVGSVTLGLPGIPPVFLGVRPEVASQKGFYTKYGVNVTLKTFTTGTDAMRAVINGQIDAAWAPTPTVLAAIANGAPLVGMLSKCNLTINDVKTINFPGAAGMNAQIAGQLTVNVDHVDEVSQIEDKTGKPVTIVMKLADVDPYQHYDMLVATKDGVKAHYFDFVHMLEGDVFATKWMLGNFGAAAQIAMITGDSFNVSQAALQHYLAINWWPYKTSGLTVQRINRTIGLYTKLGTIPASANLTWKQVVDTRMWKQAHAALSHAASI